MRLFIGKYPKNSRKRKCRIEISGDDVFSLDHTLSMIIWPSIKKFRESTKSCPMDLTSKEWDKILMEMEEGFHLHAQRS